MVLKIEKDGGGTASAATSASRQRSPNFPALPFPEALKRARTVYERDRRNPVSGSVILEHLGYGKNVSGSAGRVLSALRQYGLLEDTADDKYRVSDSAFYILTLPEDSAKRWEAVAKCATRPPTFKEILNKYPEELPSDSTLREYLIVDRKFNPTSVENFIRALKGTVEFAKLYDTSYDALEDQPEGDDVHEQGPHLDQRSKSKPPPPPLLGVAREVSSLPEGEAVLQWPATMSKESVADLEDWLALVVKKLKRRYASE